MPEYLYGVTLQIYGFMRFYFILGSEVSDASEVTFMAFHRMYIAQQKTRIIASLTSLASLDDAIRYGRVAAV